MLFAVMGTAQNTRKKSEPSTFCLFVSLLVDLFAYLLVCFLVCLLALHVCLFVCQFSACLFACLFVCLFVSFYLLVFVYSLSVPYFDNRLWTAYIKRFLQGPHQF